VPINWIPHLETLYKQTADALSVKALAQPVGNEEILNVLLIDDEPMLLSLIPLIINHFDPNLRVETLTDPSKAVEMVVKNPYDVVVADYSMPEVNGLNLVKAIKNVRDVPCILYTGRGSEELRLESFASGVDDYVKKIDNPNEYGVLTNRIRAAVMRHREMRRLSLVAEVC
jgi:DNA-binding response OmpR family regulator